jgi:prophage regulatory protein
MSLLNGTAVTENNISKIVKVLSNSDVSKKVNLSTSTIWRGVRDGWFPPPIELSPNRVGWIESEIDTWVLEKAQNRGGV